jgi:hypothetical protein
LLNGHVLNVHEHLCLRSSIVRAFLIEEQRIVAMVMKSKKGAAPTDAVAPTAPATSQKSK